MVAASLWPTLDAARRLTLGEDPEGRVLDIEVARRCETPSERGVGPWSLQLGAAEAGTALSHVLSYWREIRPQPTCPRACTGRDTIPAPGKGRSRPRPAARLGPVVLGGAHRMTGADVGPEGAEVLLRSLWRNGTRMLAARTWPSRNCTEYKTSEAARTRVERW